MQRAVSVYLPASLSSHSYLKWLAQNSHASKALSSDFLALKLHLKVFFPEIHSHTHTHTYFLNLKTSLVNGSALTLDPNAIQEMLPGTAWHCSMNWCLV